jgi:hypothetical protein
MWRGQDVDRGSPAATKEGTRTPKMHERSGQRPQAFSVGLPGVQSGHSADYTEGARDVSRRKQRVAAGRRGGRRNPSHCPAGLG